MRSSLCTLLTGAFTVLAQPLAAQECSCSLELSQSVESASDLPRELKDVLLVLFPDYLGTGDEPLFNPAEVTADASLGQSMTIISSSVMNKTWFVTIQVKGYQYPHTIGFNRFPSGEFLLLPGCQFVGPKCSVLEAVDDGVGTSSLLISR
ncbi:MAG: hypothetical protein ABJN35_11175 [Erythrobacter sp.]